MPIRKLAVLVDDFAASGRSFEATIPAFSLDSPHQPSGRLH